MNLGIIVKIKKYDGTVVLQANVASMTTTKPDYKELPGVSKYDNPKSFRVFDVNLTLLDGTETTVEDIENETDIHYDYTYSKPETNIDVDVDARTNVTNMRRGILGW